MAALYWRREVKAIMDGIIHELVDELISGDGKQTGEELATLRKVREYREFANMVDAVMEKKDQEEEARQIEKKEETHDADGGA